ncbi:HAD superfamily hydrolase (TIGR01549 family) [Paenibacillus sp. DS2015]|uniref:HAD family hydrolase n=1 Tax=Paenibacillus sp. DS2015 TaxID=3373917 RepID=UPI003D1AB0EC
MKLTKPEAMIFDMDGTLFQTETVLLPAYHEMFNILRKEGLFIGATPPEEIILSCLGMLLEDIWKKVMPGTNEVTRRRADELLLQLQLEYLSRNDGTSQLYPNVAETLQSLKDQGVKLFVASNGLEHYVKGVAQSHALTPLFDDLYSAGEYNTRSKVDLVDILLKTHHIQSAWMVGDRSSDVEAGKKNGQFVVGCQYAGFGGDEELEGSDEIITSFEQLLSLYERAD